MSTPGQPSEPSLESALREFLEAEQATAPAPPAPPARQPGPPAAGRPAAVPTPTAASASAGGAARPVTPPKAMEELQAAYAGVLKHEAAKAALREVARPPLWRRMLMPSLLLVLTASSAYVWFGNPSWLAGPPHARLQQSKAPLTGQRQLLAIALEIEDFRRTTARLPRDLAELGLNVPFVTYTAWADLAYELRLGTGPHALLYRSSRNAEAQMQPRDAS